MKITCGVPVYVATDRIGYVCGIRVDAVNDRVTGIIVRNDDARDWCYHLAFEQIAHTGPEAIHAYAPFAGLESFNDAGCAAELERMRYWLTTLVPEKGRDEDGGSAQFVVFANGERGEFTLAASGAVDLNRYGCGALQGVDVDARGYIDHVVIEVDETTGATAQLRPLAKRSPEEVVERAHTGVKLR